MKRLLPALWLAALIVQSPSSSNAITADELATYLGISSWNTIVDLPFGSYDVELFEFQDGKIGKRLWIDQTNMGIGLENRLSVCFVMGTDGGRLKCTAIVSSVQRSTTKHVGGTASQSVFSDTLKANPPVLLGLPEKITTGDYLMALELPSGSDGFSAERDLPAEEFVKKYEKGIFLRVKAREKKH